MAIQSIPETIQAQQANRGTFLQNNEEENQYQAESGYVPTNDVIIYILKLIIVVNNTSLKHQYIIESYCKFN